MAHTEAFLGESRTQSFCADAPYDTVFIIIRNMRFQRIFPERRNKMLVSRKDLENAMKIIAACIPKKSYHAVLECCRIDFQEDGIVLMATDFETAASICVPSLDGEELKGSIIVHAGKLASLVGKGKKDAEIQIRLNSNKLLFGNAKIQASASADEFPEVPSPPAKGCRVYPLNPDFSQAVKFVAPAMAKDIGRHPRNRHITAAPQKSDTGFHHHPAADQNKGSRQSSQKNLTPVFLHPKRHLHHTDN
jgi:hypothetical protein